MFLLLLHFFIATVKIVNLVVEVLVVAAVVATIDAVNPNDIGLSFMTSASCSFFIYPNSRGIQPFRMRLASF